MDPPARLLSHERIAVSAVDTLVIARVLHVIGVVLWIGGVAFVTTVVLPAVRRIPDAGQQVALFEAIEGRFALQARVVTVVTGLSGLYMLHRMGAWERYLDPSYWWVHLMTLIWLAFTLILFVLEPLFLHRWFLVNGKRDPERTFAIMQRMHWVLLTLSLIAIVGAVAGVRGYLRFDGP
jgi:uncharacterized membrane protein